MNSHRSARRFTSVAALALLTAAPGCFLFRGGEAAEPEPAPKPVVAQPSDYAFPAAEAPLQYAVGHWNTHQGDELHIDRVAFRGDQWNMVRTHAGVITRRDVSVSVYTEDPAGASCKTSRCSLTQNEEGGTWSDGHLVCERPYAATCESVATIESVAGIGREADAI